MPPDSISLLLSWGNCYDHNNNNQRDMDKDRYCSSHSFKDEYLRTKPSPMDLHKSLPTRRSNFITKTTGDQQVTRNPQGNPQENSWGNVFRDEDLAPTLLDLLAQATNPDTDLPIRQETFWLSLLLLYFPTSQGCTFSAVSGPPSIPGQDAAYVTICSDRTYNSISQPRPFYHRLLQVICLSVIDESADHSLCRDLQTIHQKNLDPDVAMHPWQKPLLILSRPNATGETIVRTSEWQGNNTYLQSASQVNNLHCRGTG